MLSPALFISAVSGVIRLGKATRNAYKDKLLQQDFTVLLNTFPIHKPDDVKWKAIEFLFRDKELIAKCHPGGEFDAIFAPECLQDRRTMILQDQNPMQDKQIPLVIDAFYEAMRERITAALETRIEFAADMDPRVQYLHKEWLTSATPSGWARFGLELAQVALDVVGAQPQVFGFDKRAEHVLRALAPSLDNLIDRQKLDGGGEEGFGERLIKTFVHTALVSMSERPELITSEDRWKPVVTGLIEPLKDQVAASEGLEFLAHDKLMRVFSGPMAHGALQAINNNADAFLKGDARGESLMGEITRAVLGDAVSVDHTNFNLFKSFTQNGALRIYDATLKTAAARPELFVRGVSEETGAVRTLVQRLAGVMEKEAPPPFDLSSGLSPDIVALTFGVAEEYAVGRIQAKAGDKDWDSAWADVYSHLVGDILSGFGEGLGEEHDLLSRLFSRDQALDLIKIMAGHIAAAPHMATGGEANSEVQLIARAAAQAVASDEFGLLNSSDWRVVIGAMTESAAKNPGVLFSVSAEDGLQHQLGLALIQNVLFSAADSFQNSPRELGGILFGETLREALLATLNAANANLASSILSGGEDDVNKHIAGLGLFIEQLNKHATTGSAETAMNADDWLHVYKYYIAHVLERGPDVVAEIDSVAVANALRTSAN